MDSHAHREGQSVVRELNMGKSPEDETRICFFMRKIVCDVRKPCALRLQLRYQLEGLRDRLMHGMGSVAECAQHQIVHASKQRFRRRREITEISQICETSDPV